MTRDETKIIEDGRMFKFEAAGDELRGKMPEDEKAALLEILKDPKLRQDLSLYFAVQMYDFWSEVRSDHNNPDNFFIASSIGLRSIRTYRSVTEIAKRGYWSEETASPEFYAVQLRAMEICPLGYPQNTEASIEYRHNRDEALRLAETELVNRWSGQNG